MIDDEVKLPLVVFPRLAAPLADQSLALRRCVARYLPRLGVILFRGFSLRNHHDFGQFVAALREPPEHPLPGFRVPGPPRLTRLAPRLTSSEGQALPEALARFRGEREAGEVLQAERWYCRRSPERVWLYCANGRAYVTVADGREVHAGLSKELCESWTENGLLISRSYSAAGRSSWHGAFGSMDPRYVEAWCDAEGFVWEWQSGDRLRIDKVCLPIARHARTGDHVWFNGAHAFQPPRVRDSRSLPGVEVYSGTGEPLAASELRAIRAEFDAVKRVVPCEPGDVIVLDNLLMAHAVERGLADDALLYVLREYPKGAEPPDTDPVLG